MASTTYRIAAGVYVDLLTGRTIEDTGAGWAITDANGYAVDITSRLLDARKVAAAGPQAPIAAVTRILADWAGAAIHAGDYVLAKRLGDANRDLANKRQALR